MAAETRYWTVAELNTNIPLGLLLQNRLLWLTVALLALLLVLRRFRLDLAEQSDAPLQTTNAMAPQQRNELRNPQFKRSLRYRASPRKPPSRSLSRN